jgi:hypothetical protein
MKITMDLIIYWIGALLAILGGCSHYLGLIMEKYVINRLPKETKLMKSLIKEPLWLLAIFIRFGIGSIFFIAAEIIIGPAITPGLMASGLIVLAIGSIKILKERLNLMEILAIIQIIIAVSLIGLSGFSIEISEANLLDAGFLIRMIIYTAFLTIIVIIFHIILSKISAIKGILLALISGLMLSLNNFWITSFIWSFVKIQGSPFNFGAFFLLIISSVILIIANVLAIIKMSQGFKLGNASYLAPIQNVPVQLTPSILYYLVFIMVPPSIISIVLLILGIILIIISSFILGNRQAEVEKIK